MYSGTRASLKGSSLGAYRRLAEDIGEKQKVLIEPVRRAACAPDASHYIFVPEAVILAANQSDVSTVLSFATQENKGVTFRSGGTSLSGQSGAPQIMVDTRRAFRGIEVLDDGKMVWVQPGTTIRAVNSALARYGRILGPDPASEVAATVGGIIANNSSGMACGTALNSYSTVKSLVYVLPSGTVVDSSRLDADSQLKRDEPALVQGIAELREELLADPNLVSEVRRQYSIKNTMGYGLNSFLDFDSPVEILTHLMIGSEGTLGFISEAIFETVPVLPLASTGFALFPDLYSATSHLPELIQTGARTIELLDAESLRVVGDNPVLAETLGNRTIKDQAALLIEFQHSDPEELKESVATARNVISSAGGIGYRPTSDNEVRTQIWKMRKGLYATVAGARRSGTTALLEDIGVPVERLADTCHALQGLFVKHGYSNSPIFGHAKDGNIHFLITEDLSGGQVERLRAFTEDMVGLVLDAGGTLKSEHGTGRIMAPYVERQFGEALYSIMKKIKALVDPAGVMNPGVLLGGKEGSHFVDLKETPPVEDIVDRCVECGYCEPICPSKDLTLTPRQRIALRRARQAAKLEGNEALDRALAEGEVYQSIETCAVDGLCQTVCPLGINTGDLVRGLRHEKATHVLDRGWGLAADHWNVVTRAASVGLSLASHIPMVAEAATRVGRVCIGDDVIPQWTKDLPGGGMPRVASAAGKSNAAGVLFSACVDTMFASAPGRKGVSQALTALCKKANLELVVPNGIRGLCCGTPWKSKGLQSGYQKMVNRVVEELTDASDGGRLPIICDNSSCTEGLVIALKDAEPRLEVVDVLSFVNEHILPRLSTHQVVERLVLHPTCGSTRLGINSQLEAIANVVAGQVHIPEAWGCCAFAGDRGMLHPELTASATMREAAEVREGKYDSHASCNRTCEMGISRATGEEYCHILELLDQASQPIR